jgi:hypothetical protein
MYGGRPSIANECCFASSISLLLFLLLLLGCAFIPTVDFYWGWAGIIDSKNIPPTFSSPPPSSLPFPYHQYSDDILIFSQIAAM